MARTALSVQSISRAGIAPSFSAANAEGHSVINEGNVFIEVKNGSGSEITVTVQTPASVDGLAIAEIAVAVPATTGDKMIGPFPPHICNQAGGAIYVDFSAVTSITCAAFKLA